MSLKRRDFINVTALAAGTVALAGLNSCTTSREKTNEQTTMKEIQSMTKNVNPISLEERRSRIDKAQNLLKEAGMQALVLDAGTSMTYFTGMSWWPSERPMVVIIPAEGEISYVCPGFEEERLHELIIIGKKVYAWQEHESPYKLIATVFKDYGISTGEIGIDERLRFFILDGLQKEAPNLSYVSGDPVTIPCRLIKSPAEIALMQKATDITAEAIKIGLLNLKEGSSPSDFSDAVAAAHAALGGRHAFAMANFGEASAFPHGSIQPQKLKIGDVVLVDCGCTVEGYNSDISRTIVFGAEPTARQIEIWDLEKKSQAAGFAAAQIGAPCEAVDAAARQVIVDAGFGPGYQLPGLPHRTGHGIGMDGHEWGNAVKGNKQILEPGICFSIEPNISIVGEFGIRHEDCVYMTADGPKWFSQPSVSIAQPFA